MEEKKVEARAVNVEFDAEGNPQVSPLVNESEEEQEEEGQGSAQIDEEEGDDQPDDQPDEGEDDQPDEGEDDQPDEGEDDQPDEGEDDVPEHIQRYMEFYRETGGSFEDFTRVNQDFSNASEDEILREYLSRTNPELDSDEIEFMIEDQFGYDEDLDDESDIKRKKIARKRTFKEASRFLEEQRDKYKTELVSSQVTPEAQEALEFYRKHKEEQEAGSERVSKQRESFIQETERLYGKDFEGFEVTVGDYVYTYRPTDVEAVKASNSDINNFISKFTDKEGNVTDVAGWHKAMTAANDPEGYAEFFYELGRTAALEEDAIESKNVTDSKVRTQHQPKKDPNAPKFRFLEDDNPFGKGKIKLKNY